MPSALVGASLPRFPAPRYFEKLSFLELAPRTPLPKPGTLARFRRELPAGAALSLVVPPEAYRTPRGAFRDDPSTELGRAWLDAALDAIQPDFVVLATGRDLSPGVRDRELLSEFVAALRKRTKAPIVWEHGGAWETEEAQLFAQKLGITLAFDPLDAVAPEGALSYARVRAIGARARLGEGLLASIAVKVLEGEAERVVIALEAEPAKARRLVALLEGAAEAASDEPSSGVVEGLDEDEDEDDDEDDEDDEDDDDEDDEDDDEEE